MSNDPADASSVADIDSDDGEDPIPVIIQMPLRQPSVETVRHNSTARESSIPTIISTRVWLVEVSLPPCNIEVRLNMARENAERTVMYYSAMGRTDSPASMNNIAKYPECVIPFPE